MQLETILKIITTFFASLGAINVFYRIRTTKRSQLREEYKFAKDFLEEYENNRNLHPFAIEKGYEAIAGNRSVRTEEIVYILSLKNPSQCLNDYLKGKKYLGKLDTYNDFKLDFSKKYSTSWSRKWRKTLYFTLYFFCSFLALAPLFLTRSFPLLIITIVVYGFCALWCLESAGRISDAERLVKNQQKHSSTIYSPSNNPYTLK